MHYKTEQYLNNPQILGSVFVVVVRSGLGIAHIVVVIIKNYVRFCSKTTRLQVIPMHIRWTDGEEIKTGLYISRGIRYLNTHGLKVDAVKKD